MEHPPFLPHKLVDPGLILVYLNAMNPIAAYAFTAIASRKRADALPVAGAKTFTATIASPGAVFTDSSGVDFTHHDPSSLAGQAVRGAA